MRMEKASASRSTAAAPPRRRRRARRVLRVDWRAANNLFSALRKCCNHPFLFEGPSGRGGDGQACTGVGQAAHPRPRAAQAAAAQPPRRHLRAEHVDARHPRAVLPRAAVRVHAARRHDQPRAAQPQHLVVQRVGPHKALPLLDARGRPRRQPHRRRQRRALRLRLQPAGRPAGDRPHPPHRPDAPRHRVAAHHARLGRGAHRARGRQAPPRGGGRGPEDASSLPLQARTISREDTLTMLQDAAIGVRDNHGAPRKLTDAQVDAMVEDASAPVRGPCRGHARGQHHRRRHGPRPRPRAGARPRQDGDAGRSARPRPSGASRPSPPPARPRRPRCTPVGGGAGGPWNGSASVAAQPWARA